MPKYRVVYTSGNEVYLDVEANTVKEAEAIAKKADGGDFTESKGTEIWEYKATLKIS
jgi:hypothetical protein